jgi:hypothetical protein
LEPGRPQFLAARILHEQSLPRHGNVERLLRRHEVIEVYDILGNGDLHAFDATRKLVTTRTVVGRNGRSVVHSHVATIIGDEIRSIQKKAKDLGLVVTLTTAA